METSGLVFDIQRFSLYDGPGIRTLVFVKGCDLRCPWCSNPEGWQPWPQLVWREERCIGCGKCAKACPHEATRHERGGLVFDRARCSNCGGCAEVCPSGAREVVGRAMRADEVVKKVLADKPFFDSSGGGVTLSGGEVLKQGRFVAKILELCRAEGVHTAVETSGYGRWEGLELIARYTDLFLYDIKHLDPVFHKRLTGVSNRPIVANLMRLVRLHRRVVLRFPIIPSCNDSRENVFALKRLVDELPGISEVHLLPYHRLGIGKYQGLGIEYPLKDVNPLTPEDLKECCEILRTSHAQVRVIW